MDILDAEVAGKADVEHTHVGLAPGDHDHADYEAHGADTTAVHGIADTSVLATATDVGTAVEAHRLDTTNVHGIADTDALATDAEVASAVAAHSADTTDVHGIANTALLITAATHALIDHDDIPGSTSIPVQDDAPASPDLHDLWVDSDEPAITGGGGGVSIPQQDTAPADPAEDDLWIDTDAQSGSSVDIGYAQVTANQASIGTSDTDLTGLSKTVTVPSGHRIKITAHVGGFQQVSSSGIGFLLIKESTTLLNQSYASIVSGSYWSAHCEAVLTPSPGSHTYKLAAKTTAGTMTMEAAATYPAYILIEDLGVASA